MDFFMLHTFLPCFVLHQHLQLSGFLNFVIDGRLQKTVPIIPNWRNLWLASVFIILASSQYSIQQELGVAEPSSCHATFTSAQFTVFFPRRNSSYDCEVSIVAPNSENGLNSVCRLRIEFEQFQLVSSTSCHEEFLQIGARRLCGSISGTQIVRIRNSPLVLKYRASGKEDLQLDIQQERCHQSSTPQSCDHSITDLETEISSPNYPNAYPTPITCIYTIFPVSPEICQFYVKFIDFNIPEAPDCLKGRLLINEKAYCGFKAGWTVVSNFTDPSIITFSAGSGEYPGNFRLLIRQDACDKSTHQNDSSPSQIAYLPPNLSCPQCCNKIFNEPRFILHSPGFLGQHTDFNCVYQIVPSSPSICRLRLNFVHFWLGNEDVFYGCTDAYLEIDGRRWCGCKDGLTVVTHFQGGFKNLPLAMRVNGNKGFIIEVTQEECGRGRSIAQDQTTENPDHQFEVFATNATVERKKSRFLVPSDNDRCYEWGLPHFFDKVRGILESVFYQCPAPSLAIGDRTFPYTNSGPGYPAEPFSPLFGNLNPQCVPSKPLPPQFPPILPPQYPYPPIPPIQPPQFPQMPNYPDFPFPVPPIRPPHFPNILPQNMPPQFPPSSPIQPPLFLPPVPNVPSCISFFRLSGEIVSPNYPWEYPPNQKSCFRIRQAPGFCSVKIAFLDFDVVWSPKCWKDYVLLDQKARYCGRSLQSSAVNLRFRGGNANVDFVTDGLLASRGFRARFWLVPCSSPYQRSSDFKLENEATN